MMMTVFDDISGDIGIGKVTEQQLSCYQNFSTPLHKAPFIILYQRKE
jgi:hypothetical protein